MEINNRKENSKYSKSLIDHVTDTLENFLWRLEGLSEASLNPKRNCLHFTLMSLGNPTLLLILSYG